MMGWGTPNNRLKYIQDRFPSQTPRHTRPHTAVSPVGSQIREGREPVEHAGLDARYRVGVEVPRERERTNVTQRKIFNTLALAMGAQRRRGPRRRSIRAGQG